MYYRTARVEPIHRFEVDEATRQAAHRVFDVAETKLRALATEHPDYLPIFTDGGKWVHDKEKWTNWGEGFTPGQMWLVYEQRRTDEWAQRAAHYTSLVRGRELDVRTHDHGFLIATCFKQQWELTGDEQAKQVALTAGRTLGGRFDERCGMIPSFVAPSSTFIDVMRNVGLVLWAGLETGDEELVRRARVHCRTTRRHLVRGDGSTAHEGIFDTDTGAFVKMTVHQGWRSDSSWNRGLAWSLAGFTECYALDPQPDFLATAQLNAEFWMSHTSEAEPVPPNDFEEPNPVRRWESSGAVAAAQGLFHLARYTADENQARAYHDRALATFRTLASPEFLAAEDPDWEGILKHGTYHENKNLGVDESVNWGEYFFVEFARDLLADQTCQVAVP